MTPAQIQTVTNILKLRGVNLSIGLSDLEIKEVESAFGFTFPPDLRQFLKTVLPTSHQFPDWREAIKQIDVRTTIETQLNWPLEGLLFDVENADFWMADWGDKPLTKLERAEIVMSQYKRMPKLIPVSGHRYISSMPEEAGNPVLSVYQLDIIFYGVDLFDYFKNEFQRSNTRDSRKDERKPKAIRFWGEIASGTIDVYE